MRTAISRHERLDILIVVNNKFTNLQNNAFLPELTETESHVLNLYEYKI